MMINNFLRVLSQTFLTKTTSDNNFKKPTNLISKNMCMQLILEKFPEFTTSWVAYKKWWGEDESGFYNDMSQFSRYVINLLKPKKCTPSELKEIFDYAEYLIENGDFDVQNAVCTCFLENILNQIPDQIDADQFVPYLGKESRGYCRAWDEFTGVKTEGLW